MNRREWLRGLGSVGLATLLAGCSLDASGTETDTTSTSPSDGNQQSTETATTTTATATPESDSRFDRVVDAVDDLGMDPNGNEPIDATLDAELSDGTLVEFPPGEYLFTSSVVKRGLSRAGVRSATGNREDVRFLPEKGRGIRCFELFDSRDVLIESVTWDQRSDWKTSVGNVFTGDNVVVRDVEYAGWNPPEPAGGIKSLSVRANAPNHECLVDGFVHHGPFAFLKYPKNPLCFHVGEGHKGHLTLRDFDVKYAGECAIYASHCPGTVGVEGGYFENCVHTAIRVGGEGSYVSGSTIVVDTDRATDKNRDLGPPGDVWESMRGIWWESGIFGKTGGYIENCELVYRSAKEGSAGAIIVDGSAGGLVIRNTRIHDDVASTPPLIVNAVGESGMLKNNTVAKPHAVTIDGVHITGRSSGKWGAIDIRGRDGSVVRNSRIDMRGFRNGIVFRNAKDCKIVNTSINTCGSPTLLVNAELKRRSVRAGSLTCSHGHQAGTPR